MKLIRNKIGAKLSTPRLHLKLELRHNETSRTSRLEIASKTLMRELSSSLMKFDDNREILMH